MTIKDCISKIYPSLTAVINGAVVKDLKKSTTQMGQWV